MRRVRDRLEDIGADGEWLAGALRELVHGVREYVGFRVMRAGVQLFPAYSRAIMLDAYYSGVHECARAFAVLHTPFDPDRCAHGVRVRDVTTHDAGATVRVRMNPCQRCAEEALRSGPFGPRCLHGVELSQQPACCVVTDELRAKMNAIVAEELGHVKAERAEWSAAAEKEGAK